MLNEDFGLNGKGTSNALDSIEMPRHRWYFYKEGFSPQLVKQAITDSELDNSALIIDPFNGSGTTTLTSSLLGYKSLGVEVNPFTSYLAQAKQLNAKTSKVFQEKDNLIESVQKGTASPLLEYSTFSELGKNEKWLFNSDVLNAFEGGWQYTNTIKSYHSKRVLRLALIIAAMNSCNAKRDGKCFRYRPTWKEKGLDASTFTNELLSILEIIENDLSSTKLSGQSTLIHGDIRKIAGRLNDNQKFDLCVTSPPYVNTFDYTDIYRPELFLGKFIDGNEELYKQRLKTVRSHVQAKWKSPKKKDFGLMYRNSMEHLLNNKDKLMHKYIPEMVQAYFEDMENILSKLLLKANPKANLWLVVSNSAYANKELPVDLILADIGCQAGWKLREVGVLRYIRKRKTKYSPDIRQLRESVVILTKE